MLALMMKTAQVCIEGPSAWRRHKALRSFCVGGQYCRMLVHPASRQHPFPAVTTGDAPDIATGTWASTDLTFSTGRFKGVILDVCLPSGSDKWPPPTRLPARLRGTAIPPPYFPVEVRVGVPGGGWGCMAPLVHVKSSVFRQTMFPRTCLPRLLCLLQVSCCSLLSSGRALQGPVRPHFPRPTAGGKNQDLVLPGELWCHIKVLCLKCTHPGK